jgi:hypothetical protein
MPDSSRENSGNAAEFAEFAAALTGDLAVMARRHGLQTLAYLLDLARLEAEAAAGRPKAN